MTVKFTDLDGELITITASRKALEKIQFYATMYSCNKSRENFTKQQNGERVTCGAIRNAETAQLYWFAISDALNK